MTDLIRSTTAIPDDGPPPTWEVLAAALVAVQQPSCAGGDAGPALDALVALARRRADRPPLHLVEAMAALRAREADGATGAGLSCWTMAAAAGQPCSI